MKKLLILLAVLFFYVFLKSDTIEQKQWREERKGMEYMRTSFNLNWNNFAEYLKDAYKTGREKILKSRY